MSTRATIQLLQSAYVALSAIDDNHPLLVQLHRALCAPAAFAISRSNRPDHDFAIELPSGTTVTLPATADAIKEVVSWLGQYDKLAHEARTNTNIGLAQARFFANLGVGTRVSPVQYDIDKTLRVKRYDERGQELLPTLSLDDLD